MNKISLLLLAFVSVCASSNDEFSEFNSEINKAQETVDRSKRLLPHNQIHLLLEKKADLIPDGKNSGQSATDKKNTQTDSAAQNQRLNNSSGRKERGGNSDNDNSQSQQAADSGNREELKPETVTDADIRAMAEAEEKARAAAALRRQNEIERAARLKKEQQKIKSQRPVYVSPLLSGNDSGSGSNNASIKMPKGRHIKYGITIGTKIPVELTEGASSVQPGLTSVKLLKDVSGYKSVLPAGSIVFARPKAVLGSDRLFLSASKVLDTSNNDEFSIRGYIRAEDGNAGLYASIVSDPRDFKRAVVSGENAIVTSVIDSLPSDSIVGTATKVTAETMHNQKKEKQNFENGQVALVVEALPQKAFLIIEQTF